MTSRISLLCPVVVATALAMVLACGSSSQRVAPEAPAAGPAMAMAGPEQPMIAVAVERPRTMFDILPGEADMAVGANLLQLRSSPLFTELLLPWFKQEYGDWSQTLETECGIDFFTAVHSVVVAGRFSSTRDAVVMARGLDRSELVRCLGRVHGANGTAEVVEDGALTQVRRPGDSTWLGWLDSSTLVLGPRMARGELEHRLRGVDGLAGNAAMMELIDKVVIESGLWLVIRQGSGGSAMPAGIRAMYATVNVIGGLEINAAVRVDGAEQARSMAELIRPQLQSASTTPLGAYLTRIDVGTRDSDILLRLMLNDDEVTNLMQLLSTDPLFKGLLGP